jgi:hypothetical protein
MPSAPPSYVSLSQSVCQDYAVHARTTVTFDGAQTTVWKGNVGLFPGTSITNVVFPNFVEAGAGLIYTPSTSFAGLVLANHAAFMLARADGVSINTTEIGGLTFTPGTYRSGSFIAISSVVTLDGLNQTNPTFLFQALEYLATVPNVYFILINGAKPQNIFWALGEAALLSGGITLPGSILAGTNIAFGAGAEVQGCALAQTAVTFAGTGSVTSGKQ